MEQAGLDWVRRVGLVAVTLMMLRGSAAVAQGAGSAAGQSELGSSQAADRERASSFAARVAEERRLRALEMDRAYRLGCPATGMPVTRNSVATATDFVELKRTACALGCPVYTVRVNGDGRVTWRGVEQVVVKGSASSAILSNDARALMQRVADRGFWPLCMQYGRGPVGIVRTLTSLSIAGSVKSVEDVGGAAPSWLRALDADIDKTADTHQWWHGGPQVETFGADRLLVDLDAPKRGVTPLMRAAGLRDARVLRALLPTLPDVNAQDASGWTALMYAAQAGAAENVGLLLDAGAYGLARSFSGETAMSAAVVSVVQPELKIARLVRAGVGVNELDTRGVSPLMLACRYAQPGLVSALLAAGADVAKRDVDGKMAAVYLGFRSMTDGLKGDAIRRMLQVAR